MSRRIPIIFLAGLLLVTVTCTNKKVNNPLANVGSKQPDKVLFDRAMDALKHNRFDVARLTLQTLINTYPDSEFIARAKLAVADSWYAEGGSTALTQAEIEYKDFKTFFPNMPEAAEAQLKVANIHYQQMEKPDRDYTHAMRAEEEYRALMLEFPDSKLVPEAKQRLLEVQEVIAEREFRIGRFYYLRQSYPAAIARLRSLVDRYPLYSRADESLYLLGQAYEGEITMVRARATCVSANTPPNCMPETAKAGMIQEFTKGAAEAYARILSRYPLMDRADDAKARLQALHQPVPRPTKAAVAQNKAEEDSRRETGMFGKVLRNFRKHPDVAQATKVGDPTLVDPKITSASDVVRQATRAMVGSGATPAGSNTVSVETVGKGSPPPDQPAPRSDAPAPSALPGDNSAPSPATPSDSHELKPNVPADANELKPNVSPSVTNDSAQALPPPQQVNEITPSAANQAASGQAGKSDGSADDTASSSSQQKDDDTAVSSSKHKKKKGLRKIVPF
jgi:outer membrane protein assembly factor BamD